MDTPLKGVLLSGCPPFAANRDTAFSVGGRAGGQQKFARMQRFERSVIFLRQTVPASISAKAEA
jgi:hypothetical protein